MPPTVTAVGTRADLTTALFAEEARALGRAVGSRRREFQTGRACARHALARVGLPATAVGGGSHGEPLWPRGVVGSITHCSGYRACAVARARDLRAIGIDAEPHAPLPGGVLEAICGPAERRALRALPAGVCWDRLLFSAKEAVFKAWFPLSGRRLDFDDAELLLDPHEGTFIARLAGEPGWLDGRWRVCGGIAATAVVVT
ncbi:MAG: 4'-phosphopantetheinyl transferase family protein [Solirubrobacteraceae bacterium]